VIGAEQWNATTAQWVHRWRVALGRGPGAALQALPTCPLLPGAHHCVPTRVLVRTSHNVPERVAHAAPWLVMGTHSSCDVRLTAGELLQCVVWTTEDARRRSTVHMLDLGGLQPTGVRGRGADDAEWWYSASRATLLVDEVVVVSAADSQLLLMPMRFRFPTAGRRFDRGEWGSQPPVVAVARRFNVQFDILASAYWHVCAKFADVHVGWKADAVRDAVRGKVVFANPPWTRAWGEAVAHFALAEHDAESILVLPVWPTASFWVTLERSARATEVHRWPAKTKGLFAPELHDFGGSVMKGVPTAVSVWRVVCS